MTWLLPSVIPAFRGKARTIGEPEPAARKAARVARWAKSAKGRAYVRAWESRPDVKARRKEQHKRWLESELGKAWLARNRERRNAYHRLRYQTDGGKKREYIRLKQREYRAKKKGTQ